MYIYICISFIDSWAHINQLYIFSDHMNQLYRCSDLYHMYQHQFYLANHEHHHPHSTHTYIKIYDTYRYIDAYV